MQNSKILSFLESSRNNLELWNSSWKWPIFCQVHIGCFSHTIFGPELDFQSWITHIEKTRSFLELACFCHFQSIGYYSYLVFILKHDIQCFNSKFHPFWDLPETIWNSWNGMFFALNLILNAEFQNCIIPGISFPNVIILCTFKIIY